MLKAGTADLLKYADPNFDFSSKAGPSIFHALKGIESNVHWGAFTTELLVNAKDVRHAFTDASEVISHLARKYPK